VIGKGYTERALTEIEALQLSFEHLQVTRYSLTITTDACVSGYGVFDQFVSSSLFAFEHVLFFSHRRPSNECCVDFISICTKDIEQSLYGVLEQ